MQEFALGVSPLQSRGAFIAKQKKRDELHPSLAGEEEVWKLYIYLAITLLDRVSSPESLATTARSLPSTMLLDPMATGFTPFSNSLNAWSAKLWEMNCKLRVTLASLAKEFTPLG
jgi:hypothetical protein